MSDAPIPFIVEPRLCSTHVEACDTLVQLAATICETPFALITLRQGESYRCVSCFGMPFFQPSCAIKLCAYTAQQQELLVIPDVTQDTHFNMHPLVISDPHVRFYAGVPLVANDGSVFGTVSVFDTQPRTLQPSQLSSLAVLGHQAEVHFLLQQRIVILEHTVIQHTQLEQEAVNTLLHEESAEHGLNAQALLKSQATIYALLDAIPDVMLRVSHDGTFLNFRAAKAFVSSLAVTMPLSKNIADIEPAELSHQFMAAIAQTLHTGEIQTFTYPVTVDTVTHTREARVVVSGNDEVLIIVRDITMQKQVEAALVIERAMLTQRVEERTAALRAANAELARSARLKDEFLASMSHELRTPLNAVLGLSEALQEEVYGSLNEQQAKALHTIEESGRHLLTLINDILELSKIEAGKLELTIGTVGIEGLCETSLRLIKQEALKKRLTISTSFDSAVTTVQADERRLKQMLVNLLSNAVKFTGEGGAIGIKVVGDTTNGVMHCTVWDTGIGIATADMPRVFQPFVQLDSSLSRHYDGTGLGLALVYRMAEMHGGSVAITSTVGMGSRFTLSLPWSEEDDNRIEIDTNPTLHVTQPHTDTLSRTSFRHALVVEDSHPATDQIVRYLQEIGVTASVFPQGEGAVEQALMCQPDVVILDIELPQQSGWDVLAQLKANERTRSIPVLIVSVVDEPERAQSLGASGYLVKPIARQQLHNTLYALATPVTERNLVIATPRKAQPSATSPVILLAEDNEQNITTLVDYLSAKGYRVVVARNGSEAIVCAHEVRPDVILMDIQMPVMDGLMAIRAIRADPELVMIPIIALTALAMPNDRERCLEAGANEYMIKPVSLQGVARAIEAQRHDSTLAEERIS